MLCSLFGLTLTAAAQISPGPLSKAHRDLGGPAGCTQCHAVSTGAPKFRCLDCHREIAQGLAQNKGLHVGYMNGQTGDNACVKCHMEHNGEDFNIVHWDIKQFKHASTGFNLEGKHATLQCTQCHNAQHILPSERPLIKNPQHSFLGLGTTCTSCHEDKHKGTLGPNCLQCHTLDVWKPKFDHSKTKYPLTGAHLTVKCDSCHTQGADGQVRYTGLKFDTCAACHRDPHKGAFQQSCESCHSTVAWKLPGVSLKFDHSKTKYPLLGKHLQVACETCHKGADFHAPLAHDTCSSCHRDVHNGQFLARADGGKCDSCHDVNGFKPAKFALADHDKTGFPLKGKHAGVSCDKCHAPAGKATVFKVKFDGCLNCHKDVHVAQFAAAPYFNKCERCHDENGFRPSSFTLARHDKTRFVLAGAHLAIACVDCHKPVDNLTYAAYHFARLDCAGCHEDPHKGEFAARMQKTGADHKPLGCEACHNTKTWHDLTKFDHGSTTFVLTGAHRATDCAACHKPPNLERTLMNVDFRAAPAQCEDCHEDPHGSQFLLAGAKATTCATCHNTMKWRPSLFDHEKTAFSLKGAHANIACKKCHVTTRDVEGVPVLFYKPTPTKCDSCHGNGIPQTKTEEKKTS